MHPLSRAIAAIAAIAALVALAAACGTPAKRGEERPPDRRVTHPEAVVSVHRGIASWYGGRHHGRGTSSGERYHKRALTAAHRSFPMNTRVRVTNQRNGRSVIVRINDRGPFVRGRIIDVSEAAAEQLEMKRAGVVPVKVERLR